MTPDEARLALTRQTGRAVVQVLDVLNATTTIDELLAAVPAVVDYYAEGSAALAADHYEDLRDAVNAVRSFSVTPIIEDRADKLRRAILWAVEPLRLAEPDRVLAESRLGGVVQLETARPFRTTILKNSHDDPASVGWRRVSGVGCKFCRMLAGNGATYRETTARFAAHPHCDCTAAPVFEGTDGPEASVLQYVASQRRKTPAQRLALNSYLAALPD